MLDHHDSCYNDITGLVDTANILILRRLSTLTNKTRSKTSTQDIAFKHKKNLLYWKIDQTVEQVTKRGCGVSILGNS